MTIDVPTDRIAMSQKECAVLKVRHGIRPGKRSQVEAIRWSRLGTQQPRRIQRRLEAHGDQALGRDSRGQPSNSRGAASFRRQVVQSHRRCDLEFGPTFASEQLAEPVLDVCPQTLRRWLLEEGLALSRLTPMRKRAAKLRERKLGLLAYSQPPVARAGTCEALCY